MYLQEAGTDQRLIHEDVPDIVITFGMRRAYRLY